MLSSIIQESQLIPYDTSALPAAPWLVFAAHPDDETFGMGGTLLLARQQGIPVNLVVLTDGALGGQPAETALAATREAETRQVAAQLGFQDLHFWREPDRRLRVTEMLVRRVADHVAATQPATVFFPSPLELHPDHRAAAALVWQGLQQATFGGSAYAYEITVQTRVNQLIDITSVAAEKRRVMELYASQTQQGNYVQLVEALDVARTFTLPPHVHQAEGYFAFPTGCPGPLAAHTIASLQPFFHAQTERTLPLVSVIVRTKNRPLSLQEALQSVAAQSYPEIELIVVNDGGQDVEALVEGFAPLVSALQYVALRESRGRAAAANAGLARATGDYILLLDDDDLLDPSHLADLVEALEARPGVSLAYTGVRKEGHGATEIINTSYDSARLRVNNLFPIHAALFSRHLLEAGCRFDEQLAVYEDWDFWLQLAEQTDFLHLNQVSATYRSLGNSDVYQPATGRRGRAEVLAKWSPRWSSTQRAAVFDALLRESETARRRVKSSTSYRLGRLLIFPASVLKRWWRRLSSWRIFTR